MKQFAMVHLSLKQLKKTFIDRLLRAKEFYDLDWKSTIREDVLFIQKHDQDLFQFELVSQKDNHVIKTHSSSQKTVKQSGNYLDFLKKFSKKENGVLLIDYIFYCLDIFRKMLPGNIKVLSIVQNDLIGKFFEELGYVVKNR